MKSKLYSDKNHTITLRFPVRTYSYLFDLKHFSCSRGYTHLKALIRLVETTVKETF